MAPIIGPGRGGSGIQDLNFNQAWDSGFRFQTGWDSGFRYQLKKSVQVISKFNPRFLWDSNFRAIFRDSYFKVAGIQASNGWDSGFKLCLSFKLEKSFGVFKDPKILVRLIINRTA